MIDLDLLYTFEEARAIIKTSKSQMRKLLRENEISAFKIGKYGWRIPKESIERYIKSKMDCKV